MVHVGTQRSQMSRAMADGVAARFGVELSAAVTGIAGPAGGTPEKPVGMVCVATRVDGVTESVTMIVPGDRSEIRGRAAQNALFQLQRRLRPA